MSTLQCPAQLILARHAEAEYEHPVWSDEGGCLTRRGRVQAHELARRLASRRVAHVWTSTLARAVQTGEIVAGELGVGVTTRAGLREFDVGDFAGGSTATEPFADVLEAWHQGDLDREIPGGETGAQVVRRVRGVLQEIADAHPGETVLVVGHADSLRLTAGRVARLDAAVSSLDNCGTLEITADADDWVCSHRG